MDNDDKAPDDVDRLRAAFRRYGPRYDTNKWPSDVDAKPASDDDKPLPPNPLMAG